MRIDSPLHFKKRYQHKMVPFLPLKVLYLDKMLGAAVAVSTPHLRGRQAQRLAELKEDLRIIEDRSRDPDGPCWELSYL